MNHAQNSTVLQKAKVLSLDLSQTLIEESGKSRRGPYRPPKEISQTQE